jgi:hypothetical protein
MSRDLFGRPQKFGEVEVSGHLAKSRHQAGIQNESIARWHTGLAESGCQPCPRKSHSGFGVKFVMVDYPSCTTEFH